MSQALTARLAGGALLKKLNGSSPLTVACRVNKAGVKSLDESHETTHSGG